MKTFLNWLLTTLDPDAYHGHHRRPPFFEGWYFKIVDASFQNRFAVIPGIFLSNDPHSFIQVLNGSETTAEYFRFQLDAFSASRQSFHVEIGPNSFSPQKLTLDIDRPEGRISGQLRFQGLNPWPVSLASPGIMGWYAWVPTMECYHGVVSLDHVIEGSLSINGHSIDFTNGRGYIEKDWGKSFPSAWIWMQSNHFDQSGISLTASIAMIPWQFTRFRGFIVGMLLDGRLYRFATYTGAETLELRVDDHAVHWSVEGRTQGSRHRLELHAARTDTTLIAGPTTIDMGKRVPESLTAEIEVRLTRISGRQETEIFHGVGHSAGLEIYNIDEELLSVG